jgi:hypothetical protein
VESPRGGKQRQATTHPPSGRQDEEFGGLSPVISAFAMSPSGTATVEEAWMRVVACGRRYPVIPYPGEAHCILDSNNGQPHGGMDRSHAE